MAFPRVNSLKTAADLRARLEAVKKGGGEAAVKRHKERGKMFVRERIENVIDPDTPFLEFSALAANGMYGALWATCGDNDCTGSNPTITGIGGTSASAPALAGVLALINQKLGGTGRLGQTSCVFDQLAKTHPEAFHPIASGNNAVVCAPGTPNCAANGFLKGYDAAGAYNLATGLGSVVGPAAV